MSTDLSRASESAGSHSTVNTGVHSPEGERGGGGGGGRGKREGEREREREGERYRLRCVVNDTITMHGYLYGISHWTEHIPNKEGNGYTLR